MSRPSAMQPVPARRSSELAPLQRDLPDPDRVLGDVPAADADRVDLGHERPCPGRAGHDGLLRRARLHGHRPRRDDRLLPQARLSLVVETAAALERLAEVAALERSPRARRMLVIVNPYATTMSDRVKSLVVYALQGRYDVHAVDTQAKGHAIELCREAAHEGYDVVVAFGGDGTVNEAANGLAGSRTPLTCLPGGATNVYCRTLGIPNDVVDATEHLLRMADEFEPRKVDTGKVNGRHFVFSAGIGLDASVVERVDAQPRLKARLGPWYFTWAALTALKRATPLEMPTLIPRIFANRDGAVAGHRHVEALTGLHSFRIESADERPLPLEVDGDFVGEIEA